MKGTWERIQHVEGETHTYTHPESGAYGQVHIQDTGPSPGAYAIASRRHGLRVRISDNKALPPLVGHVSRHDTVDEAKKAVEEYIHHPVFGVGASEAAMVSDLVTARTAMNAALAKDGVVRAMVTTNPEAVSLHKRLLSNLGEKAGTESNAMRKAHQASIKAYTTGTSDDHEAAKKAHLAARNLFTAGDRPYPEAAEFADNHAFQEAHALHREMTEAGHDVDSMGYTGSWALRQFARDSKLKQWSHPLGASEVLRNLRKVS